MTQELTDEGKELVKRGLQILNTCFLFLHLTLFLANINFLPLNCRKTKKATAGRWGSKKKNLAGKVW